MPPTTTEAVPDRLLFGRRRREGTVRMPRPESDVQAAGEATAGDGLRRGSRRPSGAHQAGLIKELELNSKRAR